VPRVLVIDDQPHVRAGILLALEANGFEAVGAGDANSGLREFQSSQFDLAIVDLYMPGTDGVTLIKALRERAPAFPVIAMSGVLLNESHRTALDFLPNLPALSDVVCLQKPFRPPELLKAIQAAQARAAYAGD
jgi:DNA-binding response OmpR family regulator